MSAFSAVQTDIIVPRGFDVVESGVSPAIMPEDIINLARLKRGISKEEYLKLGFPRPVFRIDPQSPVGLALAPSQIAAIGDVRFEGNRGVYIDKFAELSGNELRAVIKKWLLRDEADHISCPLRQEKISAQLPLVMSIIQLDRAIYETPKASVYITLDQKEALPDMVRTPGWHTDEFSREARFYLVRTSLPTEMILDNSNQLKPEAQELLAEIKRRHASEVDGSLILLPKNIRDNWRQSLKELDLFYQPNAYDVVICSGDVWHCSSIPEVPTPSSMLRVAVVPR